VISVDRPPLVPSAPGSAAYDLLRRGRRSVAVDLKHDQGAEVVLRLVAGADALLEGFRPGVAERLGIGAEQCLAANPRLVYARMTGWGQDGPLADKVGHDINYAGIVGAIAAIGEPGRKPVPPLNLVADFGGGAMFCLTGILAALLERTMSGKGQVVDVAMVDGVASLMTMFWSMRANGGWSDDRGSNMLDGGAPFYDTYECADGEYVAVGAIEEQFWQQVVDGLGLQDAPPRTDASQWGALRKRMQEVFLTKTRDEWSELFADRPACVTPVLRLSEAPRHPHVRAREAMTEQDGVMRPNVAPRFSRTPTELPPLAGRPDALAAWGL
jgi:alpha-methylacyl-CoA racemase